MVIVIYTVLLLACSFTLCVFGFFVGRCARKLPILDDNLPWTIHRGQISAGECRAGQRPDAELPRCLRAILRSPITMTSLSRECSSPLPGSGSAAFNRGRHSDTQWQHGQLTSDTKRPSTGRSTGGLYLWPEDGISLTLAYWLS
jgi:hypothetical protein